MNTLVLPMDALPSELDLAWRNLQEQDAALRSPFLHPEFARAVASVRDDVEVAVMEENGSPVGFFAYQRSRGDCGKPVGAMMSDCQAVVANPHLEWNPIDLLRNCRLSTWEYDSLVSHQPQFRPFHFHTEDTVYMDLSGGFDAYRAARRKAGSRKIKQTRNRLHRLEREVGPVRYEPRASDTDVLRTLFQWKSAQYRKTRVTDVFAFDWTTALVRRVAERHDESFGGMLSALYAGDRLVAIDLGVRSHDVLHLWIGAYDPTFAKYSPGNVLIFEHAKAAASLGIQRIDLGKLTDMSYKLSFASGRVPVACGCVPGHRISGRLRRGWRQTKSWAKSSRWAAPVRLAGNLTRPLRDPFIFR